MYTVYQHIFPNGKRYIGVTRNSVHKRWGYKGYNYRSQFVGRAIEKYGWDNIEHDIFCVCETKEQAEKVERFLVSYFDTINPEHGYNVLPGGDVSVNDATPEMRYKLGNGNRGRKHTDEEKRKISEGCKRAFDRPESNGCIGKKASDETKEKMRIARKKYLSDSENAKAQSERSSKVMKTLWKDESFREKSLARLKSCCRKPGEYHWSEESKAKLSESLKGRWIGDKSPCAKAVVCLTMDGEFVRRYGSTAEAARDVGTATTNISKCCNKKTHYLSIKGFVWQYESEYLSCVSSKNT
jgi:group I intron endonuclease